MGMTESAIVFLSLPYSPKSVSDENVTMSFLASATTLVPCRPRPGTEFIGTAPSVFWSRAPATVLCSFFTTGSRMNAAAEPSCRPLTTPEHLNQAMDEPKPM